MRHRHLFFAFAIFFLVVDRGSAQNLEQVGKAPPFAFSGDVSNRLVFYNASGIPARRDAFGYALGGNLNVAIYELYLPFTFTLTNQGSSYGQPFNQFGVSPVYKWATLHLGYRNISHSSFTLAGHQMFGAGFDLNPGKFRFGFMYGRLRRAVQFIPRPDSLSLDTLLQTHPLPVADDPVYKRNGWSAKVGYGDNNNFIDLILFKAADQGTSLADDSVKQLVRPAENAVIGIHARKMLFNKLSLYVEGAMSAYTRDREHPDEGGPPLSASEGKLFRSLLPANSTTSYYRALKAGLNYTHTKFNIQTEYQRIDPDYQSMGAYFFNNDIESLSLTPVFYLMKSKVIVTSGLVHQRDNLNDKKAVSTHRTIPRLNLSINPDYRYGFDIGYQDMRTQQQSGMLELTDSTRMRMSNPGITLGGRYNILDSIRTHSFMLMLNRFELKDRNPITREYSQYVATIVNFNYNFYLVKKSLGFNVSVTTNALETYVGEMRSIGVSVGGNKGFREDQFMLNASWSANFADQGDSHSAVVGVAYTPGGRFSGSVNLNFLAASQAASDFREISGFVECRYRFGKTGARKQ